MNIFQKIFYFFSSNTDPSERRVAKFFAKLDEHQTKDDIKQDLDYVLLVSACWAIQIPQILYFWRATKRPQ